MTLSAHMRRSGEATWPRGGALFSEAGQAWSPSRLGALASALASGEWSPERAWLSNRGFRWEAIHVARATRPDGPRVKD